MRLIALFARLWNARSGGSQTAHTGFMTKALLGFLSAGLISSQVFAMDSLSALRWNKRVVIVFGEADDPRMGRQIRLFEQNKADLSDRDMVLIRVSGDAAEVVYGDEVQPDAQRLRAEAGVRTGFAVVLVGKDGGVKARHDDVVAEDEIFGLIDSMPMRRAEKDRAK